MHLRCHGYHQSGRTFWFITRIGRDAAVRRVRYFERRAGYGHPVVTLTRHWRKK